MTKQVSNWTKMSQLLAVAGLLVAVSTGSAFAQGGTGDTGTGATGTSSDASGGTGTGTDMSGGTSTGGTGTDMSSGTGTDMSGGSGTGSDMGGGTGTESNMSGGSGTGGSGSMADTGGEPLVLFVGGLFMLSAGVIWLRRRQLA